MHDKVTTLPQISTYASSIKQVELAIKAGADHLILEDPLLSLRSFSTDDAFDEPVPINRSCQQ